MKTRSFPDSWLHGTKNPLSTFTELCQEIYEALNGIKQYYQEFFDKHSPISIDTYLDEFNKTYEEFVEIATPEGYKENFVYSSNSEQHAKNLKNWYASDRFFSLENNNCRPGLYDWTEDYKRVTTMFISDEFKPQLLKLINKIFNIEDFAFPTVKSIWEHELKDSDNLFNNNNQPFFALIKVLDEWRDKSTNRAHMNKRVATSASLITNEHLSTFHESEAHIAITYKLNDGLLASYHSDAFLHEDIVLPFGNISDTKRSRTNNVNTIYDSETSLAYATYGCKIYTPKHIMKETLENSYNEVILDSRVSEPNAVVLFTYNGKKPEKDYYIAKNLAERLGLPLRFVDKGYDKFKDSSLRAVHNEDELSL